MNKIQTRIVSLLVAITITIGLLPGLKVNASVVASGDCGANGDNVSWTLDDAGTLTIKGSGAMADYAYSSDVPWMNYRNSITSVVINYGVTSIGKYAFYSFTSLPSITIPDSVTSIGKDSFYCCTNLTSVTIPNSVTSIGEGAFKSCDKLKTTDNSISIDKALYDSNKDLFPDIPLTSFNFTKYAITYTSDGNGTVSGADESASTDKITLTITPNANYVIDTVTYTDNGTEKTINKDANGNYSFTMPSEDVTVSATFKRVKADVTFVSDDGTVLQTTNYTLNAVPSFTEATPTKAADDQYTYTFAGWSDGTKTYGPTDTLPAVTDDATYTAAFDSTVKQYTIKFIDEDGSVLQSGNFDYGTTPVYTGTTPTKAEDDDYTYAFAGWAPAITSVTGNTTYTATFTGTLKPTPTPEPTPVADEEVPAIVSGIAHVQDVGNVTTYMDPETGFLYLGTEGQGKRLESITLYFDNPTKYSGTLEYRVHVQDIGWTDWVTAGNPAGTEGMSKRIEAIEIRLTGELADNYSVFYGVHIQDYGDMQGWVQDGALAGTTGESKRIEALAVVIVPKGMEDNISVQYRVHVQDYGWEGSYAADGKMAGTSGQSKRLEGIEMFITGCPYSGGIQYKTHIQDYGWESSWTKNGEMSGTQGQSKRLEGICIELYGEVAEYYDIYYRVHAQDIGWMAWAKNGECAGTAGRSARLEGIQIVLVPKGDPAPGATYEGITAVTDKAFIEGF